MTLNSIFDKTYSYKFLIPGVPPVTCFDEYQFLLREGNSGDFFSSETPVVFSDVCISSLKQQVSKVCPAAVSLLLESAR